MGALESKRWSEIPPETPQPVDKRISRLQIADPRSPLGEQRTPIQLETYEESPQNRELSVDPRSPSFTITRTPISVPIARESSRESKENAEIDHGEDANSGVQEVNIADQDEVFGNENAQAEEPLSPDIDQIKRILSDVSMTPVSPGAPLSKKDTARLLKKTASPSDLKRKRRLSGRRQSVPQKLFSDKVAPAPRSPLAQRNSVEITEAVRKGNRLSFRVQKKKRLSLQEGLYIGKENSHAPLVIM